MASFPAYFQRDSPFPMLQPPPHPQATQKQLQTLISETTEAPEGTAATLLVRHLPEGIPGDMLSRLFSHYGATSVRPCAGGKLRNCAFVDFSEEAIASQAQLQLNRLRFLGKVITVDRADKSVSKSINPQTAGLSLKDASGLPVLAMKDSSGGPKAMESGGEPIAPRLGVDYPFPPHLEYAYPPPDGNILTNIVNALIAVPNFYIQALHLMNKMNLPAPFCMALPTPPLPPPVPSPQPPPPPVTPKFQLADLSSESELESSEEETNVAHSHKRTKREAIVGPAIDKGIEHEAVGLKPAALIPKEVPMIKKKNPMLQIKITAKSAQKDTSEDDTRISESTEPTVWGKLSYLTPEEIGKGKMPPEEILSLPMFKNYATGNPSIVLYIKNLAKDVLVDDFHFIFGSLFGSAEAAKSNLNIKLMQLGDGQVVLEAWCIRVKLGATGARSLVYPREVRRDWKKGIRMDVPPNEGRMRGQAFVTFPSVDLAHRALNLVNGYQFKGKPIIIQFGRSPSAKTN